MMENSNTIKIYAGTRNWYELVLATIFYTVTAYTILLFLYYLTFAFNGKEAMLKLFDFFYLGLPSLASALAFSVTKDIEIENNSSIISYYKVGPFTKTVKTSTIAFEYVSVFQETEGVFQTNLWYKGNKHYKMYEFEVKADAFKFGTLVSDKLNIDLLDATERGNNKWVEKT